MKKIFFLSLLLLCLSFYGFSQTGSIKGVVTEKGSTETIIGANVIIEGTTTGSCSDLDGNYEIKNLKAGNYTLLISFISYKKQRIENVEVVEGKATVLNIELEPLTQVLQIFDVVAKIQRANENILLLEQKKATEIVQHIGAEELSRKGIGDVATAVSKITGISKIEGSNDIYVRGLGDRYNSTSYNGLPMPSNDPEQKNISLDLFTTDIVEYISIDKVYNNRIYGDFAGGNVDINAKEHIGEDFIFVEIETAANFSALNEKNFMLKPEADFLGFHSSEPPSSIANFNFENPYQLASKTPVASGYSLAVGKNFLTAKGRELSVFSSLNFSNSFSNKEGISLNVNNSGYASLDLRMKTYDYSTNTTGICNLSYKINKKNSLRYHFLFINSSSNSTERYEGTILDIADYDNGLLVRKTYTKNSVFINQVLGKHKLFSNTDFNWGLSYNSVSSDMPDRMQNTFRMEDGEYLFGQNQITDNHRYYHYLVEDEFAANALLTYAFNKEKENDYKIKLSLGGTSRYKVRSFNATQFNFRIHTDQRNTVVDPNNLSLFFNQENLDKGNYFRVETFRGSSQVPNALDPQYYGGTQIIHAVYLTTEYKISPKFTALIGLRGESVYQLVEWNTQLDPTDREEAFEIIGILPNITTKYEINDKQNLRFGASKTYTLPQFKERVLFIYEEVTQVKLGNPDLKPSENYNVDLKWELFPKTGEIVSLGAFGKYILNPINEVTISSATNDISFLNTGEWGYVYGLEFETRKEIFSKEKNTLTAGFNTSYMITNQELNSEKIKEETMYLVNFTDEQARFTGASDLLINADISYKRTWNDNANLFMASLSYSYFSDRVYAIGTNTRGNIIEKPFNSLDVTIKAKWDKLSCGLNFKNLLNEAIEIYQANENKDITVLSYKKGIIASVKIGYRF
jgi:hypothetical protein